MRSVFAADDTGDGVRVTDIVSGSSAAAAGVRVGDRITAVDGVPTPDTAALVVAVRRRAAGQRVVVTVVRDGRSRRLGAVLDRAEPEGAGADQGPFTPPATTQLVVATP